jgi:hypothetical protein
MTWKSYFWLMMSFCSTFWGENAEALRSDLQIRFNAGERLITTQECPEFSPVKGCPGTIARLSMSNPFDLSMYALVGVMAIIAVASTWYPKDRKINFYIFLLSIVTFLGLVVLGFLNWFIEGSAYGALVSCVCIIFLCMTRLRLIVYRYNVKSSVKRIVASVKEGKRVAFIAHQNLELRKSWYQCSAQCFQSSRVLYMGHLVSEWIMRLNSLNSETVQMKGISLFFLTSKTLTPG